MTLDGGMPVERSNFEVVVKDPTAETMKENASVVDSSLTGRKHDIEDCDVPESSSYKDSEECYTGTEGERVHPFGQMDNLSPMRNEKTHTTRYFIIKSLSHQNIQLSIERGIWATQVMNEPILDEAFHNSGKVILIFSVNMSGFFQGYAQMMSSVSWRRDNVWSQSSGGNNPWGRSFKVKWLRLQNLPFQNTLHLKNPLNDYKPVKISRDCQELSEDIGEALCELFDGEADFKGKLKRSSSFTDDILVKRACGNSPVDLQDKDCILPVHSAHIRWDGATVLHPSLLYQHAAQPDVHNRLMTMERCSRDWVLENVPSHSELQNVLHMKRSHAHESLQPNNNSYPNERNRAVSLSEEDILDMTYEEYLRVIGRSFVPSNHLETVGPSWTMHGSPITQKDNDPYSNYLTDWNRCQKKS